MSMLEDGKLGKYVISGTLGRGAMGTVYDGRDPVIDRRVAIKTISLSLAGDEEGAEALARFKREAQAAGRLMHPNLVGIYDYGETEALAYIVMEFVDGTSLKAVLDKQERFAPAETVRIMDQVLAGLQYSHARGVVHRDIKPANIMLTSDGVVKIADFGIARIESSSLTQAGTIMGTPAYMSPEQFMGTTVDARTDIYSAGVMLYQMLTGERPFEGSMTGIMHKALNTEPPKPSAISVTSPVGLDAVVAKAMAKRPEQRFADAAAFAAAIRAGLAAGAVAAAIEDSEATMVAVPRQRAAAPDPAHAAAPVVAEPAVKAGRNRVPVYAGLGVLVVSLACVGAYVLLAKKPAAPVVAQPKMVQPPPPLPVPVTPPPQAAAAPAPAPSAVEMLAAVRKAVSGVSCALVDANGDAQGAARVNGIVDRSAEASLRAAVDAASPAPVIWNLAVSNSSEFCTIFDVLRPFAAAGSGFVLGLKGEPASLHDNAAILPDVHFPAYGAYLTLDYIASSGDVAHLVQGAIKRGRKFPGDATTVFGQAPVPGTVSRQLPWPVGAPFGTDLLIAVASDEPLFAGQRNDETLAAYLPALRQAMQAAVAKGAKLSVAAKVVVTEK
jgi:eukaryotic-like serine/threonine-protein kinase